jgi:integrase/recombinase XerD
MLGRQAKVLTAGQVKAMLAHLTSTRHPIRNRLIFLLSLRAGLRAKEIAHLTWAMVCDAEGAIGEAIRLTDAAAKGKTDGVIPMARDLREALCAYKATYGQPPQLSIRVVGTERTRATSAQVVVNLFRRWYRDLGFEGCSSHSGRRTFITNAARNIGRVGGSLRDVQALARHASLGSTQRYIELSSDAMLKVIDLG